MKSTWLSLANSLPLKRCSRLDRDQLTDRDDRDRRHQLPGLRHEARRTPGTYGRASWAAEIRVRRSRISRRLTNIAADERGTVTAFSVALVTALLVFAGLLLDGGTGLAAKIRALGESQEAARAGAQQIDLGVFRATGSVHLAPDRATAAAYQYLAATGHIGTVEINGNTVRVTVTVVHNTTLLGLVGVNTITVAASGQAEPQTPLP